MRRHENEELSLTMSVDHPPYQALAYLARYNLLDCLSSGFLKAPDLYTRSFRDIGTLAPRHLLLFLKPLNVSELASYRDDDTQNFPVVVEMRVPSQYPMWRVTAGYEAIPAMAPETDDIAILIPFGLDLIYATSILFQNDEERNEFLSVRYDNIDPGAIASTVSSNADTAQEIMLDVHRLEGAIRTVSPLDTVRPAYQAATRLAGGLLGLDYYLSIQHIPDTIELASALLAPVSNDDYGKILRKKLGTSVPSLPALTRCSMLAPVARKAASGVSINSIVQDLQGSDQDAAALADAVLFTVVTATLIRQSREISVADLISEILLAFEASADHYPILSAEIRLRYRKALHLIHGIMNSEADMPDDFTRWPSTLGGLLLFALRPSIEKTHTWSGERDQHRISENLLALAALFSGLRAGFELMPLSVRKSNKYSWIHSLIGTFLRDLIPDWYDIASGDIPPRRLSQTARKNKSGVTTVTFVENYTGAVLSLLFSDSPSEPAKEPAVLPKEDADDAHNHVKETPIAISDTEAASSETEKRASSEQRPSPELLFLRGLNGDSNPEGDMQRFALLICKNLQWHDCIRQTFNLTASSFRLENNAEGVILEIDGYVPSKKCVMWDRLKEYLDQTSDERLEEAILIIHDRDNPGK